VQIPAGAGDLDSATASDLSLKNVPKKLQDLSGLAPDLMSRHPRSAFEFGPFRMDLAEHVLLRDGQPVPLTPKTFELLHVLVVNAGHLVERHRLLEEVWPETHIEEANLSRGISVLRKALGENGAEKYIETVPKVGYRFVAPVSQAIVIDGQGRALDAGDSAPSPDSLARPRHAGFSRPVAIGLASLAITAVAALAMFGRGTSDGGGRSAAAIHRQLTFTGKATAPELSPDGRRIAYVSSESPERLVTVQDVAEGEPTVIFSAPEAGGLRWSPDSRELLFWARGGEQDGLYLAPAAGGSARRIAGGSFVASWSPDGRTIALARFSARRIEIVSRTGEPVRTFALHDVDGWIGDIDWSPAHGRLLFVVDDGARHPAIWSIQPDGTNQRRLLSGTTEILGARWTADGQGFYHLNRINQTVSLFRSDPGLDPAAGTTPVLLLSGIEADARFSFSSDGARLVYARSPYYSNLWSVELSSDARAVRPAQLTHGTSIVERPRVSPDGSTILFTMGYETRLNLYTIPSAGGPLRQLTYLNGLAISGVWGPDGRQVAFVSNEGGEARVWMVNADGGSPRPLPAGEVSESYDLAWAPGSHVLYQRAGNRNYYAVDPATLQQHLLIDDDSVGWLGSPAYAPDGRHVAVSWNRRPLRGVWLLGVEDRQPVMVHGGQARTDAPFPIGWSPDGRFIYAVDGKRAAYRGATVPFEETITEATIVRLPANGGRPETVASLPFEEVGSITMFPDGRRIVCVVYSSRTDIWMVEDFDSAVKARGPDN
jgi:Tol biopolymer transport system component/DNA-binding winged helix-turn-helix (wHTH) protein